MKNILPIYDSPRKEKKQFQFIDVDQLYWLTDEEKESLLNFSKSNPTVKQFKNIVYTWTYFEWEKNQKIQKKSSKSINEIGLGYCSACGKFVRLKNENHRWNCMSCGYDNSKINNIKYKR